MNLFSGRFQSFKTTVRQGQCGALFTVRVIQGSPQIDQDACRRDTIFYNGLTIILEHSLFSSITWTFDEISVKYSYWNVRKLKKYILWECSLKITSTHCVILWQVERSTALLLPYTRKWHFHIKICSYMISKYVQTYLLFTVNPTYSLDSYRYLVYLLPTYLLVTGELAI